MDGEVVAGRDAENVGDVPVHHRLALGGGVTGRLDARDRIGTEPAGLREVHLEQAVRRIDALPVPPPAVVEDRCGVDDGEEPVDVVDARVGDSVLELEHLAADVVVGMDLGTDVDRTELGPGVVADRPVEGVAHDQRRSDDRGAEHRPYHDEHRFAATAGDAPDREPAVRGGGGEIHGGDQQAEHGDADHDPHRVHRDLLTWVRARGARGPASRRTRSGRCGPR